MKKLTLVFTLLAIVTVILSACGGQSAGEESTFERAKREGVIRVGFANEAPYAYAQPDGTLAGEAVEIAQTIFERLGIPEVEGVLTEFGSLIPGLEAGRFDSITAGMYIKAERCESVLFANPEFQVGTGLVVAAGNPLDLHSYADIASNSDVRVGTGEGYYEAEYLAATGVTEDQIVLFPDNTAGIAGVLAGQIDAFTATDQALSTILATDPNDAVEMAIPYDNPLIDGERVVSYAGAAFRLEDSDLQEAFNAELEKMKESGELLEILEKYNFSALNLPGEVTSVDACAP